MNKRIRKKQRRNELLGEEFGVLYTPRGVKKVAKEWIRRFPYKGRYTGRGLRTVHYYKCIDTVPVYTQCPKFKQGTWDEVLTTGIASAFCIWDILADRKERAQYLQRSKET